MITQASTCIINLYVNYFSTYLTISSICYGKAVWSHLFNMYPEVLRSLNLNVQVSSQEINQLSDTTTLGHMGLYCIIY